jgi:hypothetical protein
LPIPTTHLGIFLGLTGSDALGQGTDLNMASPLEGKVSHGDRPLVVRNHHHDEVGIPGAIPHRPHALTPTGR